ncbi:MAG: hypothetical protein A2832_02120 [Candidatus Zambryskibacteria bacterium RIFCSPHIGHO2_01_FULL_44_22b]|uniref:Uncharacterized protein n=2 Tax=Candidatus Zambryskiibacteriota TaxID=1817925 RepID=A0A1G2SZ73_9BACT|nr:MAG: hypothetical protein A2832_02120 [Candidatus Zambryskibacteria bacterium RIFCSPHIGHO2_01_FULL_44_22b]OHB05661.1 MAG: hypothetical protein A3B16_02540 [Candidatus Zambryskibacteria bacterium RIFCSPLOWO2_01_FULL_45_43]
MTKTYSKTFRILIAIIFLLPIFFIPGGYLNLAVSKAVLLSLGTVIATLVFLWETWKADKIDIPWHPVILVVALLPVIYFLSALLSTPSSLSLFGYNFEVGTFGFILLVSLLLIITSIVVADTTRILKAISALVTSLSIVALFAVIKVLSGYPTWGIFFGTAGNPVGNWTDLATTLGLLSVLLILIIGMIPMTKLLRNASYLVFALSTALLVVLNFSSVFVFTLIASVLLFIYFSKTCPLTHERSDGGRVEKTKNILPIVLGIISLVFLVNPNIGATTLGNRAAETFGINNSDIRPTFSATLSISKAVLSQGTLFGSGPNTFGRDWLIHKPTEVNTTPFWGTNFSSGSGFIPTQIASTGIAGTILWFLLLVLIVWMGIRALAVLPEPKGPRFALVSTFLAVLYLWTASFMYAPSFAVLALTFAVSGLFISSARGVMSVRSFNFSRDAATKLVSTFLLIVATIGTILVGYNALNKTLSVFYFQKAVRLSNTEARPDDPFGRGTPIADIEATIVRAIKFAPADVYYASLSRIYFAKAQQVAARTTGTAEENQAAFQSAIASSISTARSAVATNPTGYENWLALGSIYSALVPAPVSLPGAYENAKVSYSQGASMNPSSPEPFLLLAQLEVGKGDLEAARNYIRQSIFLKEDYNDAYLLLARIEVQDKNLPGAIASTEKLSALNPNNPAVYFELGLLKSSNNDNAGAVASFEKALALSPGYANAKYYLGLVLEKLGREDEARQQFEELLVTNPDSVEVKEALERLK